MTRSSASARHYSRLIQLASCHALNQRLLLSALAIDLFVATWPGLMLVLSAIVTIDYIQAARMWLFLAQLSVPLSTESLVVTVAGVLLVGRVDLKKDHFIIVLSLFGILATVISVGFGMAVAEWAAMDRGSLTPSKCLLVQAGGYMEIYFFPNLAATIIILVWALRNLTSLNNTLGVWVDKVNQNELASLSRNPNQDWAL